MMTPTKLVLIASALVLAACGLDNKLRDKCVESADCLDGYVCTGEGACVPPTTLQDGGPDLDAPVSMPDGCTPIEQCEPNQCGMVPNGCGGRLPCGGCEGMLSCGGGGVDNQCGCTAEADAELCVAEALVECGSAMVTDRCGVERAISCGTCSGAAETCGAFSHGMCDEIVCTASKWCRTLAPTLAGTLDVRSIWANGAGQAWAVASDTTSAPSRLLHFDGSNWKLVATSPRELTGVSSAGGQLWVSSRDGVVLQLAGGSLTEVSSSNYDWSSVAAISSTDVWVVGSLSDSSAKAAHFDGSVWTPVAFGDIYDLRWRFLSVSATAANAVWAVGSDGNNGSISDTTGPLVASYDGIDWTLHKNLPTSKYLRSVWARTANDVWAVGDDGVIVHYDGQSWTVSPSGVTHQLLAVTGVGSTVWAAGAGGVLLKRVGSSWVPQQTGTTRTIRTLWASSTSNIWAGGDDGLLLHYVP
ncbi:MAG: WD40/YVTN/BNR-like repeat-containing protein [Kofleriaceae bacterium]